MTPRHWKPLVELSSENFDPPHPDLVAETMKHYGITDPEARALLKDYHDSCRYFLNDLYQVQVDAYGPDKSCLHLNIRRLDGGMFKDWRHFQQIKNEIAGPEREAIELYPAESRKVDTTNKWHLWVLPEGVRMDVGWTERDVSYDEHRHVPAFASDPLRGTTMTDMFPHQTTGAKRIAERTPTYLALDMGIGKTRTFIEAVKLRRAKRVLVICPASAMLVWKREITLWHPAASVVVVRNPAHLAQEPLNGATGYYIVSHGLMSQTNGHVAEALTRCAPFDDDGHRRGPRLQRRRHQPGQGAAPRRAEAGRHHAAQRHPDAEPRRRPLHAAVRLLAAGPQGHGADDPARVRGAVLQGDPQDLRRLPHDPGHRGLEEPRRPQDADRALHDAGPQGGRFQGPPRHPLGHASRCRWTARSWPPPTSPSWTIWSIRGCGGPAASISDMARRCRG